MTTNSKDVQLEEIDIQPHGEGNLPATMVNVNIGAQVLSIDKTLQEAIALHQQNRFTEAEQCYRKILQFIPRHVDANHNLGILLLQRTQIAAALPYLKTALENNPTQGQYWLSYINALVRNGQTTFAQELLELGQQHGLRSPAANALAEKLAYILENEPTSQQVNALIALFTVGLYDEAARLAELITERFPNHGFGWKVLGAAYKRIGQSAEALPILQKAVALSPKDYEAHYNLGIALHESQQYQAAMNCYLQALQLNPDFADARHNLGNLQYEIGQLDNAIASYRRVIALKPTWVNAYDNLGLVLHETGEIDSAIACYEQALKINPRFAEAYNNLGNALQDALQIEKAIANYRLALQIKPGLAETRINLGDALASCGQFDEAFVNYRHALTMKPDNPELHYHYATALLCAGDFAHGWQEYEYRKQTENFPRRRPSEQGLWLGDSDLNGKSILLYAEQGYSDTLQFIRYAPTLAALGATVYAEVQPALKSLISSCPGITKVFTPGEALPLCDVECPLPSLPLACKTNLATIPANIPYLKSSTAKIADWRDMLGVEAVLRVGLSWTGDAHANAPRGHATRLRDRQRSLHIQQLQPLLDMEEIVFFSMQVDEATVKQLDGMHQVIDCSTELHDFEDTAALIANLDLVICVDTATAHLAGAIGKPVWLLNRYNTCWRWLRDRADSPWYPGMRIFRQPAPGDWDSVIAAVKQSLQERLRSKI